MQHNLGTIRSEAKEQAGPVGQRTVATCKTSSISKESSRRVKTHLLQSYPSLPLVCIEATTSDELPGEPLLPNVSPLLYTTTWAKFPRENASRSQARKTEKSRLLATLVVRSDTRGRLFPRLPVRASPAPSTRLYQSRLAPKRPLPTLLFDLAAARCSFFQFVRIHHMRMRVVPIPSRYDHVIKKSLP